MVEIGEEMSFHPKSSANKRIMFGFVALSALAYMPIVQADAVKNSK
jgi:hypothetical protein